MRISIITPTIYEDRLEIVRKAIENQKFNEFEWLVGSPFEYKHAKWVNDDFEGGFWSLNRIYNKLFKEAKGELIVSWQDNIWATPEALHKFWFAYKETGGVISGVGDQYQRLNEYGKPEVKVWEDPRKTHKFGNFYKCMPDDIEWNFAAFPKEAVFRVGGMDEELDFRGYGGDQLQIMERIFDVGYETYLDQTNESFTLRHGRVKDWDENHVLMNGEYDKRKAEIDTWPVLNYL